MLQSVKYTIIRNKLESSYVKENKVFQLPSKEEIVAIMKLAKLTPKDFLKDYKDYNDLIKKAIRKLCKTFKASFSSIFDNLDVLSLLRNTLYICSRKCHQFWTLLTWMILLALYPFKEDSDISLLWRKLDSKFSIDKWTRSGGKSWED